MGKKWLILFAAGAVFALRPAAAQSLRITDAPAGISAAAGEDKAKDHGGEKGRDGGRAEPVAVTATVAGTGNIVLVTVRVDSQQVAAAGWQASAMGTIGGVNLH
jgi:hypothetical protein